MKLPLILLALVYAMAFSPAFAQGYDDTRAINAMRDRARAAERQADSMERLERIERDRFRAEDRARRNAERDSRSSRRFDR